MPEIFKMKLLNIQPSQLFISDTKLKKIYEWLDIEHIECYDPLPVKSLNGKIIFTDGHTRAFALYNMGAEEVNVYWDETPDLDWEAYQICVDWCVEEGITNISGLSKRVVDDEGYETLWYDRCRKMQKALDVKRVSQKI